MLEQVVIEPVMNQWRINTAQGLIETASTAYMKMYKLYRKITELQNSSFTGEDLEGLKEDINNVEGMIQDSRSQLGDRTPVMVTSGHPSNSSSPWDSKAIERKMKFMIALDNLNLDLADIQEDLKRVTN